MMKRKIGAIVLSVLALFSMFVDSYLLFFKKSTKDTQNNDEVIDAGVKNIYPTESVQTDGKTGKVKDVGVGSQMQDGTFLGSSQSFEWGNIQVQIEVKANKIVDVTTVKYPDDSPRSVMVNKKALPKLEKQTKKNQSAKLTNITGATETSEEFMNSLQAAINTSRTEVAK
jgi:uncharacterized protein with FMN-binding domain